MTGLKPAVVGQALDALEGTYVGEVTKGLGPGPGNWYVRQVTGSARQTVGQWPTAESVLAQLVDGLNDAAEHERDPERKNRLREVAAGLGGSVRDIATDIVGPGHRAQDRARLTSRPGGALLSGGTKTIARNFRPTPFIRASASGSQFQGLPRHNYLSGLFRAITDRWPSDMERADPPLSSAL